VNVYAKRTLNRAEILHDIFAIRDGLEALHTATQQVQHHSMISPFTYTYVIGLESTKIVIGGFSNVSLDAIYKIVPRRTRILMSDFVCTLVVPHRRSTYERVLIVASIFLLLCIIGLIVFLAVHELK